jgi:hypothetical protein
MRIFSVKNFDKGLVDAIEDYSIPEAAASSSLNWLTLGDKIELSGGYTIIGTENSGSGKITGLKIGEKVDGTLFPVRTRGKKIEYYSTASSDWVEIGTDQLGTLADGEDVAIDSYVSSAGYQMWISSPNSSLYKLMMANPSSIKDMYDSSKNYKGYLTISNARSLMWNRKNNRNYIYGSYKDLQNSTTYTDVTSEAVGASGGTTYTGTLATISGKRTCFNVVFTDGTTTISDDKNGGYYNNATGAVITGTINYATGAYSVTFPSPTVGSVTVNYSREDSTVQGIADFTFSATRTASQGFYLPQNTGGDIKNILGYNDSSYCIHEKNCWLLNIDVTDLVVTNREYRINVGMENWKAAVPTGDGIYYIDSSNPIKPTFNLLTLDSSNSEVIPTPISYNIDLTGYDFSGGVGFFWNNYILFTGKTTGATNNNRVFAYNKIWKSFDVLDYYTTCFADYSGALWAGDSASNNVQKLFSTTSANGALINNYWEGKLTRLEVEELKKTKRMTFRGEIGAAQNTKISLAYDNGAFSELGRILGTGDYVDTASSHTVGSSTIGSDEIGGGGSGVEAFNYVREFRVRSSKFDQVKVRIEATAAGYMSVSQIDFYDIQTFGQKNVLRYRQTS